MLGFRKKRIPKYEIYDTPTVKNVFPIVEFTM